MENEHKTLRSIGLQQRVGTQFHWHNNNYTSFSDFLGSLNARKRKSIRKERGKIARQEISFRRTDGVDITDAQWSDFSFYQNTYAIRGMQGYLDIEFFRKIGEVMSEQILLINAVKDDSDIAAALFFKGVDSLFGRATGVAVSINNFFISKHVITRVKNMRSRTESRSFDSGAQGEHKIQRGFAPVYTYSNHWLANEEFSGAVENF